MLLLDGRDSNENPLNDILGLIRHSDGWFIDTSTN